MHPYTIINTDIDDHIDIAVLWMFVSSPWPVQAVVTHGLAIPCVPVQAAAPLAGPKTQHLRLGRYEKVGVWLLAFSILAASGLCRLWGGISGTTQTCTCESPCLFSCLCLCAHICRAGLLMGCRGRRINVHVLHQDSSVDAPIHDH